MLWPTARSELQYVRNSLTERIILIVNFSKLLNSTTKLRIISRIYATFTLIFPAEDYKIGL
jgi:hypothetical protein